MILFRTEGSATTGYGHLVRATTLAGLLKGRTRVVLSHPKEKGTRRFLAERHWRTLSLPFSHPGFPWPDIQLVLLDIRTIRPEEQELVEICRTRAIPTVQITDLGLSPLPVTLRIDGSLARPASQPDDGTENLSGPEWMLLHSRFLHFSRRPHPIRPRLRRILLALGSSASYRLLESVCSLLSRQGFLVKLAPGFTLTPNLIKALRPKVPGLRVCGPSEAMARNLYEADLALLAPGVTAYEAAATGTPALYYCHHALQRHTADAFFQAGCGHVLPQKAEGWKEDLLMNLHTLQDPKLRLSLSRQGQNLVDARGSLRLVSLLEQRGWLPPAPAGRTP